MANGEFTFDFPVWVTVNQADMQTTGLPHALKLATYSDMGSVLPVFTEELFLERYVADNKLSGVGGHEIVTANDLSVLVKEVQRAGIKLAVFDITTKKPSHRFIVDLRGLLEWLKGQ